MVGESLHNGMHADSMPDLRVTISDALVAIKDAEKTPPRWRAFPDSMHGDGASCAQASAACV